MTATDAVNHPAHYGAGRFGCECIAITRLMPFTVGNSVKYIWRHAEKNGVEDLRKAVVYLDWAVEDQTPVAISERASGPPPPSRGTRLGGGGPDARCDQ